jgi:hypothetical protein
MQVVGPEFQLPSQWIVNRMFKGMQLEDWTKLSGLTHLSLRCVYHAYGTLPAVLPRLTTLRSLVVDDRRPDAPGERCPCCPMTSLQPGAVTSSDPHCQGR